MWRQLPVIFLLPPPPLFVLRRICIEGGGPWGVSRVEDIQAGVVMHRTCRRVASALVACLVVIAGGKGLAEVEVKVPLGPPKLDRMVMPLKVYSFSGSTLATGSYGHELSIDAAPARGGFSPNLTIRYESSGGHGVLGKGWRLVGIDSIRRSLRRGVPRHIGPSGAADEDLLEYEIGKESGTLVFVDSTPQGLLYRPRAERSTFAMFYYSPTTSSWTVRTQDGVARLLGTPGARDMDGTRVFAWHIARAIHPDGYEMHFTHELEDGNLFIKQIEYDLGPSASPYPPRIVFDYGYANPLQEDMRLSYHKGYRQVLDRRRLATVTVYGSDEQGIESFRTYEITPGWDDRNIRPRMAEFSPKAAPATGTPNLPVSKFTYSSQPWAWAHIVTVNDPITDPADPARAGREQQSLRATYSNSIDRTHSRERTTSMLIDVDGDGDLDMLYVRSFTTQTWHWRENVDNTWSPTENTIALPAECNGGVADFWECNRDALERTSHLWFSIDRGFTQGLQVQSVRDFNNDGIPDLLFIHHNLAGGTHDLRVCLGSLSYSPQKTVSIGTCNTYLARTSGWGMEHRINMSYEATMVIRLVDVNGDGVLDFIRAATDTTAEVVLFGRAPGQHITETVSIPSCDAQLKSENVPLTSLGCLSLQKIHADQDGVDSRCEARQFGDLNGDGLPDLLVAGEITAGANCEPQTATGVIVYPGTGHGLDLAGAYTMDLTGSQVGWSGRGRHSNIALWSASHEWSGFYDMNGDGLPDHVQWLHEPARDVSWGSNTGRRMVVRLNTGKGFATPMNWSLCPSCPSITANLATSGLGASAYEASGGSSKWVGWSYTRQMLADFDGDGLVDFISIPQSTSPNPEFGGDVTNWVVFENTGHQPPDLLSHVEVRSMPQEPLHDGMEISVTYARPEQDTSTVKYPIWAPSYYEHHDLVTNRRRQWTVTSRDPRHDPETNQFLGFARVDVAESARTTAHFYHQDSFAPGLEYRSQVATEAAPYHPAVVYRHHETTYDWYELDPGRKWVRPTYTVTLTCSPSEACLTEEQSFAYYADEDNRKLGLLRSISYNNERHDTYDYAYTPYTSVPYLVQKTRERRTDAAANVMSEVRWQFDGDCEQPQVPMVLSKGRVCAKSVDLGGGATASTEYTYDSTGRVATERDPDGVVVTHQYHLTTPFLKSKTDAMGHVVSSSSYHPLTGSAGRTCGPQSKGGVFRCERTTFDGYGRVLEQTRDRDDPGGTYRSYRYRRYVHDYRKTVQDDILNTPSDTPCCSDDQKSTTIYHFDAFGDIIAAEKENGAYDYYRYDDEGRVTGVWRAAQASAPDEPGTPPDYEYVYDPLDRLTQATLPDGAVQSWQYEGNLIHNYDAHGFHTAMHINSFRELDSVMRTVGSSTLTSSFSHDGAGRVTHAVDPSGAIYDYEYDLGGRLSRVTLPTAEWQFDRRPSGKVTAQYAHNGAGTYMDYDGLGRPIRRVVEPPQSHCGAENGTVQWLAYEESDPAQLGRLATVESDDFAMLFQHDALGNVTGKTIEDRETRATVGYQKLYNTHGMIVSTTTPAGNSYTHTYSKEGLPESVLSGNPPSFELRIAQRNRFSLPEAMTGQSGPGLSFQRSYGYDPLLRLNALSTTIPGHQWAVGYGYDLNGNVQWMDDNLRNVSYTYGHDEANRQSNSSSSTPQGGPTATYFYHDSGVPSMILRGSDVIMYSYGPAAAQLQSMSITGPVSETYQYDHDPDTGVRCSESRSSSGRSYSRSYQWTGDERLAHVEHVEDGASYAISNWYDHMGHRWKRRVGEITTLYLDDIAEYDVETGTHRDLVAMNDVTCVRVAGGLGRCLFKDRNNVAVVVGEDGVMASATAYDPYGQRRPIVGQSVFERGYGGYRTVDPAGPRRTPLRPDVQVVPVGGRAQAGWRGGRGRRRQPAAPIPVCPRQPDDDDGQGRVSAVVVGRVQGHVERLRPAVRSDGGPTLWAAGHVRRAV